MNPWEMDWGQSAPKQPWDMDWNATGTMDRVRSAATGINKGAVLTAGLPVDTALNLFDLGKAAVGRVGGAIGLPASKLPELTDRGSVPMSSEWLTKQIQQMGGGQSIDNPNPQDMISRLLYSGGQGVVPVLAGGGAVGGAANSARNAAGGVVANVAGQGAEEAGLAPSSQILASMLAPAAGSAGARWGAGKEAQAAQSNINNQVRNQTARDVQAAGYKIPPTQVNPEQPGTTAKVLENMFGGSADTAKQMSIANQDLTTRISARAVGIPDTVPLTQAAIEKAKAPHNEVYQELRKAGPQPLDDQFKTDVTKIFKPYDELVAQYPSQRNAEIEKLRTDLMPKPNPNQAMIDSLLRNPTPNNVAAADKLGATAAAPSSDNLVTLVQRLRDKGFTNIQPARTAAEQEIGHVQLGAQNAVEDLMARNLAKSNPELLDKFHQAREMLARIATVKAAFEKASGRVVAADIGKRFTNDKPLSGGLETIGAMHETFPGAVQDVKTGVPGFGQWAPYVLAGSGVGVTGSLMAGHPGAAALAAIPAMIPPARVAARSFLLSPLGQRLLAHPKDFKAGLAARLLSESFNPDMSGLLGAYAAPPR